MRSVLLFLFVMTAAPCVSNPNVPVDRALVTALRERALTDQLGFHWLKRICKPGGRLTGSPGLETAQREAENIMREAGFQNIRRQPVMVPGWKPGTASLVVTNPEMKMTPGLSVAALGRSVPTPEGGVEGPLVVVHSPEEIETRKDEIQDAVVLINEPFPAGVLNTFSGYGKLAPGRLFGADTAARYGAKAVLVRSLTTRNDRVPHLGTLVYRSENHIPAAAISVVDAVRLQELVQQVGTVSVKLRMDCRIEPDVPSWNLIGEIPGHERPDEVVLLGAHIDSWNAGDGAHDNGSGCVHVLEALSLLIRQGVVPGRTIRCVLFVSEEYGSQGASAYADWQSRQPEKLVAAVESDRGGFVPRGFYVDGTGAQLRTLNGWLPLLNAVSIDWFRKGGSGADTSHLQMAGVRLGLAVDCQRYFDVHHSENDTVDRVHPRELELGSAALAALAFELSENDVSD